VGIAFAVPTIFIVSGFERPLRKHAVACF